MNILSHFRRHTRLFAGLAALCASPLAGAATIYWTDWTSSSTTGGFTGYGSITTPTATVQVTYHNPQGIGFFNAGSGTDYWTDNSRVRDPATSPYTSAAVDNIPTGSDIIGLRYAGSQTLTFSEAIANPVFSYVSLNGNGYSFNRDFEILSFGDPSNGNHCGYWGCGTSYKEVIDHGGGDIEYRLLGTGEPHGTIQFLGSFDSVTWNSLSNENWNGFTLGVQGTADEVFVPEPGSLALVGVAVVGLLAARRRA